MAKSALLGVISFLISSKDLMPEPTRNAIPFTEVRPSGVPGKHFGRVEFSACGLRRGKRTSKPGCVRRDSPSKPSGRDGAGYAIGSCWPDGPSAGETHVERV